MHVKVYRDDGFDSDTAVSSLRQSVANLIEVEQECLRLDIHQQGTRSRMLDRVHRGTKRHWSGDHRISRTDAERGQRGLRPRLIEIRDRVADVVDHRLRRRPLPVTAAGDSAKPRVPKD